MMMHHGGSITVVLPIVSFHPSHDHLRRQGNTSKSESESLPLALPVALPVAA